MFLIYFVYLYLIDTKTNKIKVMNTLWRLWEMIKVAKGRKLENEIVWLFYWRALLIQGYIYSLVMLFYKMNAAIYIYTPQGCYPMRNEWPAAHVALAVRKVRKD